MPVSTARRRAAMSLSSTKPPMNSSHAHNGNFARTVCGQIETEHARAALDDGEEFLR